MGRYTDCKYFDSLYDAAQRCFANISRADAQTLLREAILAPDDYVVEFNDDNYDKPHVMTLIADKLRLSCVKETPQKTHSEIVQTAAEIIKHMNDGYITAEDYAEREQFIATIERYEFTLFAAYCLLQAAHTITPEAREELHLNISRLRSLHDLIFKYTRDEKDIDTELTEFERARPIYKMLKSLQTLGYDYNFSPKERESLGIDHEDDEDLSSRFNHNNWLKRIMLLELRKEIAAAPSYISPTASSQEYEPSHLTSDQLSEKIAQLRGTYDKRRFDKNRFLMLDNAKKPYPPTGN